MVSSESGDSARLGTGACVTTSCDCCELTDRRPASDVDAVPETSVATSDTGGDAERSDGAPTLLPAPPYTLSNAEGDVDHAPGVAARFDGARPNTVVAEEGEGDAAPARGGRVRVRVDDEEEEGGLRCLGIAGNVVVDAYGSPSTRKHRV